MFSPAVRREEHCRQTSLPCVGSARSVGATLGLPRSQRVCFPGLHCSGSRLLCRELSKVGPGLRALPRSKPLRLGSRVLHEGADGLGCILCLSQVRAAQVTRCLGAHSPRWGLRLIASWSQPLGFLGGSGSTVSGVLSASPGELVSGCNPPGRCQPSRIPGSLGYKLEACSQFGRRCCLSGRVCPFPALAGALLPPTSGGGWVSAQPASSALVFAQSLAL